MNTFDAEPWTSRTFSPPDLLQIAMPLGGIGAGCLCLNGYGGLQDFSIRNKPAITALPDGHDSGEAAFALVHIKGDKPITKLVEGRFPPEKVYDQGLQAQGYRHGGHEGLPRFETCQFEAGYPFGTVTLSDPKVPLKAAVTAWNPFIPRDDINSGIPAAILEYRFENVSTQPVDFEFSYHLSHLVGDSAHGMAETHNIAVPSDKEKGGQGGIHFTSGTAPNRESYGSAALFSVGWRPRIKAMWLRGGWFDGLSSLWRELSTGAFAENDGTQPVDEANSRNGGSILGSATLKPGEAITFPIVIAWHFPNSDLTHGVTAVADCGSDCDCDTSAESAPSWRPFYAGVWPDAKAVAEYIGVHYAHLRSRTLAFQRALFSSTLPAEVLDAVSANLAILKSPTVLRQENGNVWAWEGCFTGSGCCAGSCTHVWNYAQALPHLFPRLERTLREQELQRSMDAHGHVNFRAALPDGPTGHEFHAAADGQLGGIMKLYRDWQICGDRVWLEGLYPLAKCSLDYCIEAWDPQRRGGLFEPHHNTYDIEFWGPDGMCGSIYVGALSAMALMAAHLGHSGDAAQYNALARKASQFMQDELFNGEYYQQSVQWEGLRNTSFVQQTALVDQTSSEMMRLIKAEGPKYQYGSGCLSDGVIGAWMAALYGIETPMNREQVRASIRAIFQNNFKSDLFDHDCTQRPGYALGHEPGLLLCTWPRGGKPTLPFVYSDEVWTGIEYQVASHLIEEGFVEEGLTVVRAVRSRYDGRVRNPFNEYECGSYYARAMASYALLGSLAGLRYSAVEKTLWLAPKIDIDPFEIFLSTASSWGTIRLTQDILTVNMIEGELAIDTVILTRRGAIQRVAWNVIASSDQAIQKEIVLD